MLKIISGGNLRGARAGLCLIAALAAAVLAVYLLVPAKPSQAQEANPGAIENL